MSGGKLLCAGWLGVASLHSALAKEGCGAPDALARYIEDLCPDTAHAGPLMQSWFVRGDALFVRAQSRSLAIARQGFTRAVNEREGFAHPQEQCFSERSGSDASVNRKKAKILGDLCLLEASRVANLPIIAGYEKRDVKYAVEESFAAYGLDRIRDRSPLGYPSLSVGASYGEGTIVATFDMGGRGGLGGVLPVEYYILFSDETCCLLGDLRYFLPGVEQYFVHVSSEISAGVMSIKRHPSQLAYGVHLALRFPHLIAQAFGM